MLSENRRAERRDDIIDFLASNFSSSSSSSSKRLQLESFEQENLFLEGTGSMVLDRQAMLCYACISPRTSLTVLNRFCDEMGYTLIPFSAIDNKGIPIYHTNGKKQYMLVPIAII
jgi:hypothetical protein